MKRFIVTIAAMCALTLGITGFIGSTVAHADPVSTVCSTIGGGSGCSQPANGISINGIITAVINIFSVVVGIVAVIMIILSGFRYITSGGDSSKVASAKSTLIYAVIGLVVVALAQSITQFVLGHLNGSPVTCPKGQTYNTKLKACVKSASGTPVYYYAVADKHYRLNYPL